MAEFVRKPKKVLQDEATSNTETIVNEGKIEEASVKETPTIQKEEIKNVSKNSELAEMEYFNSLSKKDKELYKKSKMDKKKLIISSVMLAIILIVGIAGTLFINYKFNEVIAKNQELQEQAESIQNQITGLQKTDDLLEEVAISGKMSKAIYEQRDEVLDLLASVESLTPNDLTFKMNKIQRLSRDVYKLDYELVPQNDPTSINKAIVDTAYMVEVIQKSKEIISVANRDERYFEIQEFRGASYSKSTNTFPMSLTVRMGDRAKVNGVGNTPDTKKLPN